MAMAIPQSFFILILASLLAVGQLPTAAAATTTSHHATPSTTYAHLHHHGHGHHHRSPPTTTSALRVVDSFTPVATHPASGEAATASTGAAAYPELQFPPQAPSPPPSSFPGADLISRAPQTEEAWLQKLSKVLESLGYKEMAYAAALLSDTAMLLSDGTSALATSTWQGPITVFAAPDVVLQAACPGCSHRRLLLRHLALGYFPYTVLAASRPIKLLAASGLCIDVGAEPGPFAAHHDSLFAGGVEISRPSLYGDGRYIVHGLDGIVPALCNDSCIVGTHCRLRRHHHRSARSAAASFVRAVIRDAISRLRERGFGFVALAMRFDLAELEKLANLTVFALDDDCIVSGRGDGYASAVRFHVVPGHRLTRADLLRLPGAILPTLAGEDQKLVVTHGAGSATGVLLNGVPVKEALLIHSTIAVHSIGVPFPRLALASSVAVASAIPMRGTCGVDVNGDCTDNEGSSASDSELVTAPPADKVASRTTTPALPHQHYTASAARPHHPVHGGLFHVTKKVGGAGVGADPVGGGHGGRAAAAVLGTGALAAFALGRLIRERKLKAHRRRQADMLKRRVQKLKKRKLDPQLCRDCQVNDNMWTATCCGYSFCSLCVVNGFLDSHVHVYRRRGGDFSFCGRDGHLVPLVEPEFDAVCPEFFFTGEEKNDGHYTTVKTFVNLTQLQARQLPKRLFVWFTRFDGRRINALKRSPVKKNLPAY
ncbi:unnamed protein product [Urochloa humidicola]